MTASEMHSMAQAQVLGAPVHYRISAPNLRPSGL